MEKREDVNDLDAVVEAFPKKFSERLKRGFTAATDAVSVCNQRDVALAPQGLTVAVRDADPIQQSRQRFLRDGATVNAVQALQNSLGAWIGGFQDHRRRSSNPGELLQRADASA